MQALILVDLQNDFLPGGALAVPQGHEAVAVANRVAARFPLVVATQDWHPADHRSFADQHAGRSPGDQVELEGLSQRLWPRHCVQGTAGAELARTLERDSIARVFRKGMHPRLDSYSAFFDNGHREATGLGDYLRLQGVTELFVLGLATDVCVKFTALDARRLGFATSLLVDGCRAVNLRAGDGQRAIDEMRAAGVRIVTQAELDTALSRDGETRVVLTEARHLRLARRGSWEFVQRHGPSGVVAVAALTGQQRLLLVEQYRVPVAARVVELPAGLAGDGGGGAESLVEAARRELREETGYEAAALTEVLRGPSSAGLTDEIITFFVARDVRRVAEGGGVGHEQIEVHEVALDELDPWLAGRRAAGCLVDARLLTGVYLLRRWLATSGS